MRVSVSWLRALVPGLTLDTPAIAERLTRAGLEVESIHSFGAGLDPVVVAKVVEVRPHPTKSGLRLVKVDRGGSPAQIQEVVCGAPNVPDPGGLVVLAPVGTHLAAAAGGKGLTLTPRTIAGVVSEGMLCSESELGIAFAISKSGAGEGDEAEAKGDGILVLPNDAGEPGTPLRKVVPAVTDDILEIGVTPNRPDALGHIGVARELAALLELPFGVPEPSAPNRILPARIESMVRVTVDKDAVERCPHYGALAIVDVTVGPSPLWVRYRLHALGVRSISNVVDVTNLVMLEYGHPLHAFDLDRLDGSAIHVRLAREGEQVVTLDGVTRTLVADDLVICDGAKDGGKPVALAGVMGAGNSEISASTKRVLIECAYFDPRGVRRTARRHGLHTESSHRFERGVDPGGVVDVLSQAGALVVRLAGGAAVTGMINAIGKEIAPQTIALRHARIEQLLGDTVDPAEVSGILDRLGCDVEPWVDGVTKVTVPTHRPDMQREVDLIEEVARVRGYDRIPTVMPRVSAQPPRDTGLLEQRVRVAASELGLSEAVHYAFANPRELEAIGAPKPVVFLANPLGEERSVMRTSLLPGLLSALQRSRRRGEKRIRLFEVGTRFLAGGSEASHGLCDEVPSFAAVLAGPRDVWLGRGDELDVFDAKGVAEEIVRRVLGREPRVELLHGDARPMHLHPRGAASLLVGDVKIGTLGPLHPDLVDRFELEGPALVIEIDLRALESLGIETPAFRPLPTLPASSRDVALEVDEQVPAGDLERKLREGAGDICETIEVFDVYRGKGVAAGKKSIAFRLTYRDPKMARTLTDAEIDKQHHKALENTKSLGAIPRM